MRLVPKIGHRTQLKLPQINDQDPRWDQFRSAASVDSLLNAYINLAKVRLKADAVATLSREKMAGMLVETFKDDSGVDYGKSSNVVVSEGVVRTGKGSSEGGYIRPVFIEDTQADFQRGTLENVVATEAGNLELEKDGVTGLYKSSGKRISPSFNFPSTETAAGVTIDWDATTPAGTNVIIETSIDGGQTWQGAVKGQGIAIETGIKFDGVDDYISVPNQPVLNPSQLTLEASIKPSDVSSRRTIIAKYGDTSGNDSYVLRIDNGKLACYVKISNTWYYAVSTTSLSINIRYHVAGTFDGSNIRVYINGIEDGSYAITGNVSASTSALRFGGPGAAVSGERFSGVIYWGRIWNYARTQAEIQTDMNRQLAGNEPGLVGYWKFNEGSGNTVYDSTANGNHGTINGGATWERALIIGDMAGKSLLLRQKLSTTDPSVTPQLHSITVSKDTSIKFADDFNLLDGSAPDSSKWVPSSELSNPDIKVLNSTLQVKTTATSVDWSTAQVRSSSLLDLTSIIRLTYKVTPDHGSQYKGSHILLCPTVVAGNVWFEPNWIRVGFENNTLYVQRKTNGTVTALLQTAWSYTGASYNMDILIAGSRLILKVDGVVKYDGSHGLNFTQAYLYLASHCSQNLTCTTFYDDVLVKQIIPNAVPNGSMDDWEIPGPPNSTNGKLCYWDNAHINGGFVDFASNYSSQYHIESAHVRANVAGNTSSKGIIISQPFILGASISYMAKREHASYAVGSFEVLDAATGTVLYSVNQNSWTTSWAEYTIDTSANIGRLAKIRLTGGTSYQGAGYGIFFDNIVVRPTVSYGKTYTLANPPATSYPDTNNKELTDGVFETPGSYTNPNWIGIQNADFIVTLDLGDTFDITGVLVYAASATTLGIYYPNAISVYVSSDGINFNLARSFDTSWKAEYSSTNTEGTKFFIEFPKVSGRYVKLQMARGGQWTFVSEIEVFTQGTLISLPGTYISTPESLNIIPAKVALTASDSGGVTYYVSRDGGTTWTEAPKDTIVDLSTQPTGQSLVVKADLQPGAVIAGLACIWGV